MASSDKKSHSHFARPRTSLASDGCQAWGHIRDALPCTRTTGSPSRHIAIGSSARTPRPACAEPPRMAARTPYSKPSPVPAPAEEPRWHHQAPSKPHDSSGVLASLRGPAGVTRHRTVRPLPGAASISPACCNSRRRGRSVDPAIIKRA